ncbi:hypothetical protein AAFC00_006422 [Neodothiora populina]|uniref:AB hydrolase-1 domain-containing protein n=1 Tax=Neodothiora populina TaxID=2781224 RepID=A0ABR3P5X3_9PEZI
MAGLLKKGFLFLLITVSLYPIFIFLLTFPWLQRHALYAHRIHSGFYHDVNQPESFGFAKSQIIPFNLSTPDGEVLYGWHVLPLDVYAENQDSIINKGISAQETKDPSILQKYGVELLKKDPEARVVINFHGNAGHVAQGWRTDTYRSLSAQPHTHVFTVDYRGFGKSTGAPTEAGIITDGIALADYVLKTSGLPSEKIVILGQSLGTAVATAVGLHFAKPAELSTLRDPDSNPLLPTSLAKRPAGQQQVFAGIILVAPFTSLPSLLLSYRIGGLVPILRPLRPYPRLTALVEKYILDKWHTALRLAAYVKALDGNKEIAASEKKGSREIGSVQIIHATNDADISVEQGRILFQIAQGASDVFDEVGKTSWKEKGKPRVSLAIVEHGGHNRIVTYAPVSLAVMRVFAG